MPQRKGDVILFDRPPSVEAWAAVGGKKEGEGPLAAGFDLLFEDNRLGQPTWEKAESELQRQCMEQLLHRAGLAPDALSLVFGGDLQCQCTASHYAMRQLDVPFAGLYGACSTMAEGLALAACFAACGLADRAAALTSSHFCTAERQYRTPLTYGGKRTPTAQWTATAAGAVLLTPTGRGPQVGAVCFGRVRDFDVTDINNMGAAMAPAAAETLLRFFARSGRRPEDYDAIYTGDLGFVGSRLLLGLAFLLGAAFLPQKLELAGMGVLFFGASRWYAVDWRRTVPQRQADFEKEQAESRRRLQDAAYRRALRDHGVKLPEEDPAD